jgi:predicted nucleic acid-binding protein
VIVVLDTNVLVSALRSRRGASFALLEVVGTGLFELALSVPLFLEYEDATSRSGLALSAADVRAVLDYLCSVAHHQPIYFLWRPFLPDPKDDMVAEAAFAAGARYVVTHNLKDFQPLPQLGIQAISPRAFLTRIRQP